MIRRWTVHGRPALLATLVVQGVVLALARPAALPEVTPGLSAAAVVVRPLEAPRPLVDGDRLAADSRLQVSFAPDAEAWTAVLWFEGDRVQALYPDPHRGQTGWTTPTTYAVPGPGEWLRLTPSRGEEFLAVVGASRPIQAIERALADPSPARVRALRRELESLAEARRGALVGVERFLPAPGGRAVAVPWNHIVGAGPLVLGWRLTVESSAWLDPGTPSSSVQESPGPSSPNAS